MDFALPLPAEQPPSPIDPPPGAPIFQLRRDVATRQ